MGDSVVDNAHRSELDRGDSEPSEGRRVMSTPVDARERGGEDVHPDAYCMYTPFVHEYEMTGSLRPSVQASPTS